MSKAEEFIKLVQSEKGIRSVVLLNPSGELLGSSGTSDAKQIMNIISYLTISSFQLKKMIGFDHPKHIVITDASGSKILVLIGKHFNLGIGLNNDALLDPLISRLSEPMQNAKL